MNFWKVTCEIQKKTEGKADQSHLHMKSDNKHSSHRPSLSLCFLHVSTRKIDFRIPIALALPSHVQSEVSIQIDYIKFGIRVGILKTQKHEDPFTLPFMAMLPPVVAANRSSVNSPTAFCSKDI